MTIKFYKISDDHRKVSKTLGTATASLSGSLKADTSILEPVIEVAYNSSILTSNYMYVDAFARYYYITNITAGAQRLYVHGKVDVLKSYDTDIRKLYALIERTQETGKANQFLSDKAFKALNYKLIRTIPFPVGSNPFTDAQGNNVDSLILTTGGYS